MKNTFFQSKEFEFIFHISLNLMNVLFLYLHAQYYCVLHLIDDVVFSLSIDMYFSIIVILILIISFPTDILLCIFIFIYSKGFVHNNNFFIIDDIFHYSLWEFLFSFIIDDIFHYRRHFLLNILKEFHFMLSLLMIRMEDILLSLVHLILFLS